MVILKIINKLIIFSYKILCKQPVILNRHLYKKAFITKVSFILQMSSLLILSLLFTVALTQNITSDDFDVGNITLFNGRSKSFPPFDNEPVITVKEGKIKGMKTKMKDGFTFYSFLGVPYASKPERFQVRNCFILNTY